MMPTTKPIATRIILTICIILSVISCSEKQISSQESTIYKNITDSQKEIVKKYITEGKYDSAITSFRPLYNCALQNNDTLNILYYGAAISQAYLFNEKLDSLRTLLKELEKYEARCTIPEIEMSLVNVRGLLAIKEDLDYQEALKYYKKGLEYAVLTHKKHNEISFLTNIVNIFYLLSDKHGLEYAERSLELAGTMNDPFSECMAEIAMAQMLSLGGENEKAISHLDNSWEKAYDNDFKSLLSNICLIYADIYNDLGRDSMADRYYSKAFEHINYSESSTSTLFYLRYGQYFEDKKDYATAMKLYRAGLNNSYKNSSLEFREELLEKMSDIYIKTTATDSATMYYMNYKNYLDSIPSRQKAQEFHNLVLRYQQQEYELEIQAKKLALANAEKRTTKIISITLVLFIMLVSGIIILVKRNKMYETLVNKHQEYLKRINSNNLIQERMSLIEDSSDISDKSEDKELALFTRIENMMKTDKVFKENSISLEKLSGYLNSNRNYVSKVINKFSGQSFHNYINTYRINEAIRIISESEGEEILFKSLSAELGYNSLSVFSKAFVKETGVAPTIYIKELKKEKSFDKTSK